MYKHVYLLGITSIKFLLTLSSFVSIIVEVYN